MLREKAIEAIKQCSDISIFRTGKDGSDYQAGVGVNIDDENGFHYYNETDEIWLITNNQEKIVVNEDVLNSFKTLLGMSEEETK